MRRYKSLILAILEYAERTAGEGCTNAPEVKGYSPLQVDYHVGLCSEGGLLHIKETPNPSGEWKKYAIVNLTWKGHSAMEKIYKGFELLDLD